MIDVIIRSATAADRSNIESLAVRAGMFTAENVSFLGEQFGANIVGKPEGAAWLVLEEGGEIVASAHYAPEPHADRMWNLYFVVVAPECEGRRYGGKLMGHVEDILKAQGDGVARTLIVETSSSDAYDETRSFYEKNGYAEEARIRQYYGPNDDKVVFWKSLLG